MPDRLRDTVLLARLRKNGAVRAVGTFMVARIWHGWASRENADAYEQLVSSHVLPGINRVDGYLGAYLLRDDDAGDEVEFVTVTLFESMDAVRAFAGDDFEAAVVPPEARRLLSRFDERSRHYRTLLEPDRSGPTS
jgi:heme-degrading monooxygenase HmoA